jgi:hypothetical protein
MYSLFLSDNYITIVRTSLFENNENLNSRLYRDKDFNIVKFDTEQEAIDFLNSTFKPEFINIKYKKNDILGSWTDMKK